MGALRQDYAEPLDVVESGASRGASYVDAFEVAEVPQQDRSAVLASLRAKVQPLVGAGEVVLPIREDLRGLLPWGGLKRGSTLTVDCSALLLATVSAATVEGSWVAFIGLPTLGFAAAAEHGVVLERTVVVVSPPIDQAAIVVASLVDALDLVVVGPGVITRSSDARRLTARARERGAILIAMGAWPEAVDVQLKVVRSAFTGLGDGHGHIQSWAVDVESCGRGAAARRRQARIVLRVEAVSPETESLEESPALAHAAFTNGTCTDDACFEFSVAKELSTFSIAKAG